MDEPELPQIPKCMSTQHPDNVHVPFFAESSEFGGEAAERICGSDVHDGHKEITGAILSSLSDNRTSDLQPLILQAAAIRKFLG